MNVAIKASSCNMILSEEIFSSLLPDYLQKASKVHFTPIEVAELATEWLTEDGKKRILDIGAGVGKFCIAGAMHSDSFFCGVELRTSLAEIANKLILNFELSNAEVKNENILYMDFSPFDAFYFYNPFYEHVAVTRRLNNEMPLSDALYREYVDYTTEQLSLRPAGTRLVTYHGDVFDVPESYELAKEGREGLLKLWIKK